MQTASCLTLTGRDEAASAALSNQEERPRCAVCNEDDAAPLVVRKGYQLVRCRHCRLVYVSPRPRSQREVDALYTADSYCKGQISHVCHDERLGEARWRLDQVERQAPARGKLLDVGCSAGSFLLVAREKGWNVTGIDVSAGAVEYAVSAHGLAAGVTTLEDAPFPDCTFDVITVFECIEHMLQPSNALCAAHRLLKDGGLLVITTPNIDGLFPRVTYHLLARTIGAWEHPTPPHHLYQFSRRTLEALLRKTGFKPLYCFTRPMGLRYTVKQMESAIIDALKRQLSPRQPRIPQLVSSIAAVPLTHYPIGRSRGTRGVAGICRGAVRAGIAGFCWALSAALYAVPVGRLDLGDSMIVAARKQ